MGTLLLWEPSETIDVLVSLSLVLWHVTIGVSVLTCAIRQLGWSFGGGERRVNVFCSGSCRNVVCESRGLNSALLLSKFQSSVPSFSASVYHWWRT